MILTFHGARELDRALRRLPGEVRQKVLGGALLAGGGIIQQAAATKAPRDVEPRRRKGKRLADSIKAKIASESPYSVTVHVLTRDPVAHLVEFGHRNVPRGKNRRKVSVTRVSKSGRISTRLEFDPSDIRTRKTGTLETVRGKQFVPAKPFMRPAFDENKEAVLQKIAEVVRAGVEAEAKRLASADHSTGRWVAGGGLTGAA